MWPNPEESAIWSHLLKKSLIENFIFLAVLKNRGRVIVKFKCRKQIKNVLFTQNVFEKEKKTCQRACYKLSKL